MGKSPITVWGRVRCLRSRTTELYVRHTSIITIPEFVQKNGIKFTTILNNYILHTYQAYFHEFFLLCSDIRWQQRIYSVGKPHLEASEVLKYSTGRPIPLNPFRFVNHIPVSVWRDLLHAVVQDIPDNILKVGKSFI